MPIINQVVKGSGGSGPTGLYREFQLDANGTLRPNTTTTHIMDFTGVTSIADYILYRAYYNNTQISGAVDMSDLTNVGRSGCQAAFYGCVGITGAILPLLTNITSPDACMEMFYGSGITSVILDNLEQINASGGNTLGYGPANGMFGNCPLTRISMKKLRQIGNSSNGYCCAGMLSNCTGLVVFYFESLNLIQGQGELSGMFRNCTALQSLWFYALDTNSFGSKTNQFYDMLSGCTDVTVHFPIRIQSTIGSWSDVTAGFGGTNTTVLFDLVTTLTGADGNTYTRQEKDSTTTATAWVYNDTLYYTSGVSDNDNGVNEPSVSDAIYSDAACTQSVTTITAIS